jgi:tetratricopeptide (TPR) repeat protein
VSTTPTAADEQTLREYERALALEPRSPDLLYNRGNALLRLARYPEALASYEAALALRPGDHEALNNRGNALRALERHAEALASYDQALALVPRYAKAHGNRGHALLALGRHAEALASYRAAFAGAADAPWLLGVANALQALEQPREALAAYERALALQPRLADAHGGRGNALQALNRHEEALAAYAAALAIDPGNAETHWNEGLARLALGDYRAGWEKYEWRWRAASLRMPARRLGRPLWLGEPELAGKTLLLHAEQGYGDAIQAIRYAPLVAARGARVLVACPAPLRGLFAAVEGVAAAFAEDDPPEPFDFHVPLMSLPLAFGTTVESIPAEVPYVRVAPERAEAWRGRLAGLPGRKVGLAWAGNPRFAGARSKACPAERLAPLAGTPGCSFVSLQTGAAAFDVRAFGGAVLADPALELATFEDTAALIGALDLVISIDTAVAHLAGALGRPVWILLPFAADWRWMRGRADSPWYPTARLFRQPRPGDWEEVVARVRRELE